MYVCHIPFWVLPFFSLPYSGRTPVFKPSPGLGQQERIIYRHFPPLIARPFPSRYNPSRISGLSGTATPTYSSVVLRSLGHCLVLLSLPFLFLGCTDELKVHATSGIVRKHVHASHRKLVPIL
jgi:hypothetical protein